MSAAASVLPAPVVCLGEMLLRLSPPAGERLLQSMTLQADIGGAEANVAVCLARLGTPSVMATILPDNDVGRAARDTLRMHGVGVGAVKFAAEGRLGLYFFTPGAVIRPPEVLYDRAGSSFALAGADAFDWSALLAGAGWLHVSGITPALSQGTGEMALAAVATARRMGVKVSFDGNYRPKLWAASGREGPPLLREILSHADLAFIEERDTALLLGRDFSGEADPRAAAAAAAFEAFPALSMMAATTRTAGAVDRHDLGATLFTRQGRHDIAPIALPGIVDRIGGGDAFAGGFLHGLSQGWEPARALRFALLSGAAKHGQRGDMSTASEAEILAMMQGGLDVRR